MNIDRSNTAQGVSLVLSGTWEADDGRGLKLALEELPAEATPLGVDAKGLDSLPQALVQVLWAYIRYARGFRRAVTVSLGTHHAEEAGFWGLTGGGWEGYFHVG